MAIYYPEPPPEKFWKEGACLGEPGSIMVPQEFNPFAWMTSAGPEPTTEGAPDYDPNKHFSILGVDGPALEYQVNGGVEVVYGHPMHIGDVITSSTHIAELSEREGRLGLMLLTTTETVLTNQDNFEVRRERTTIIRY